MSSVCFTKVRICFLLLFGILFCFILCAFSSLILFHLTLTRSYVAGIYYHVHHPSLACLHAIVCKLAQSTGEADGNGITCAHICS